MYNVNKRYQKGLKLQALFPATKGICACGCNAPLTGKKKKWASKECNDRIYHQFSILKGNNNAIRKALFKMEEGFCRLCGVYDEHWQADHIIPVHSGGGACTIENFQTLCSYCHREKTINQMVSHRAKISSHEQVKVAIVR